MHQYCSSLVYKHFVDQSESETTLSCTNSSSKLKAPQPSKSDHDVLSGISFKPNTWQYHLVKLIEDTQGHSDKVKAEIKRFVADFLEERASKLKHSAPVPSTNDVNIKKRARPITPYNNAELSTALPSSRYGHTKKRTRLTTLTDNTESSSELLSTNDQHTKKRTRPITPTNNEGSSLVLSSTNGEHTKKRARPITLVIKVDESLEKSKVYTKSSGLSPSPKVESIQPTRICKPKVTESPKDENAHYNERELQEIVSSPNCCDTPNAIQTSSRPCLNVSTDADDDDDELDNEVAMILANGVPPTVGGFRPIPEYNTPRLIQPELSNGVPPTVGVYRPIPDYNVPRLIQEPELANGVPPTEGVYRPIPEYNVPLLIQPELANGIPPTEGVYRPIPKYNVPRLIQPELANGVPPTVGVYRPIPEYNVPLLIQPELANGFPPTVGVYRPIPEYNIPRLILEPELANRAPSTVGGYRPVPEYNVPCLIKERETKELEGEAKLLGQDVAYHQCGPTLRVTSKQGRQKRSLLLGHVCIKTRSLTS